MESDVKTLLLDLRCEDCKGFDMFRKIDGFIDGDGDAETMCIVIDVDASKVDTYVEELNKMGIKVVEIL